MHHTSRPQSCFLGLVVQHGVVPKLLPIVHERVRYDLLVGIPRHIVPIPIRYIIAVAEINLITRGQRTSNHADRGYLPTGEIPRINCGVSTAGGSASGWESFSRYFNTLDPNAVSSSING